MPRFRSPTSRARRRACASGCGSRATTRRRSRRRRRCCLVRTASWRTRCAAATARPRRATRRRRPPPACSRREREARAGRRRRAASSKGWTPRCCLPCCAGSRLRRWGRSPKKPRRECGCRGTSSACPCSTASAIWRAPPSARWASAPPEARATRTAARRVGRARASAGRKNGKNGNGNRLFAHDVHVAPPRPETGDRGGVVGDRRRERGVGAPVFAIPNRKRRRRGDARSDAEGLRRGGGGGASGATAFCSCRTSTASVRRSRTPPRAGVS